MIPDKLTHIVNEWRLRSYWNFILLVAGIVIFSYVINFFIIPLFSGNFVGISSDHDVWGQFGDYVGGLLNPVAAMGAFFLLAMSIKMQQKELSDTHGILNKQSIQMWRTTQLTALSSLMEIRKTDIELARGKIKHLQDQIASHDIGFVYDLSGKEYIKEDAKKEVLKIHDIINSHVAQKNILEEKINEIASDNEIDGESQ